MLSTIWSSRIAFYTRKTNIPIMWSLLNTFRLSVGCLNRSIHLSNCILPILNAGDSKRAMDEYTSEIMMGGHNTLVIHNTCEDSLLATPLILDLVILAELCSRIKVPLIIPALCLCNVLSNSWCFQIKPAASTDDNFVSFEPVLSILSYLLKAPLVPAGTPVVNSLFRQRAAIENILRSCIGLAPISHMSLEQRVTLNISPEVYIYIVKILLFMHQV